MESSFWHARWASNRIGFHNTQTHPLLERHWPQVATGESSRVLVPLCGKSLDMRWLAAQGHVVIGVELSEIAVRDYFAELRVDPLISSVRHGPHAFAMHSHQRTTLLVGDWRHVTAELLSQAPSASAGATRIDAVYDRAALVALPPDMRETYARQLDSLSPHAPILLVTVQYDASLRGGPPFPVFEDEVRRLFPTRHCEKLGEIDSPLRDLTVQESAYLLRRPSVDQQES